MAEPDKEPSKRLYEWCSLKDYGVSTAEYDLKSEGLIGQRC